MNLTKTIFAYLIIMSTWQICFSQAETKAELIDKFFKVSNDPLMFRTDNFVENINKTNSKGFVIIYGTKSDPLQKYIYERRIQGCFRWSNHSNENFDFAYGNERDQFEVEFWKIPYGSTKPRFNEIPKDYKLKELKTPVLVHMLNISDEYCPLDFDMEFYSRFLKANLDLKAKIVVYEKKLKGYQKVKQKYFQELTLTNNISPSQIKFARGKHHGEPNVEFWLISKNTK